MRLDEILAVVAPAGVFLRTGIRGRVGNLRPGVVFRSCSILKFVVHESLQEFERVVSARIGVKALDEALHHGAQIAGGVDPVGIGGEFIGGAVKIEATVEVGKALAIELVPDDGPLRKKMGGVGGAGVIGHGPGQELVLVVKGIGAALEGWLVYGGYEGERL